MYSSHELKWDAHSAHEQNDDQQKITYFSFSIAVARIESSKRHRFQKPSSKCGRENRQRHSTWKIRIFRSTPILWSVRTDAVCDNYFRLQLLYRYWIANRCAVKIITRTVRLARSLHVCVLAVHVCGRVCGVVMRLACLWWAAAHCASSANEIVPISSSISTLDVRMRNRDEIITPSWYYPIPHAPTDWPIVCFLTSSKMKTQTLLMM